MKLQGKRALVCGASDGIGKSAAIELAKEGAEVILLARSESKLAAITKELPIPAAQKHSFISCDLENKEMLEKLITEFIKKVGGFHILVNNSGGPSPGPLLEATDEQFLTAFKRHILAPQLLVRLCLAFMQSENYGRIINVISTSVREPIANLGVSNTIRGATASWAKTLSMELPPGVSVNNVLPGYTKTGRLETLKNNMAQKRGVDKSQIEKEWLSTIPEKRLAEVEELGRVICFLASPDASYIRGVSLPVDGGRLKGI